MLRVAIAFLLLTTLMPPGLRQQEDHLRGCDGRLIDEQIFDVAKKIIAYRVDTGRAIGPLLIFSAAGDPDVLGQIATDGSLPLAEREVAANAILDQFYIANAYFQSCSRDYLAALASSLEPSLRLKGIAGLALVEHRFLLVGERKSGNAPTLFRFLFASAAEQNPRVKRAINELAAEGGAGLAMAAAWSDGRESEVAFRQLDSLPYPPVPEVEKPDSIIAEAWRNHIAAQELIDLLDGTSEPNLPFREATIEVANRLKSASRQVLIGFLERFSATMHARVHGLPFPEEFLEFFRGLSARDSDPYVRSLAYAPVSIGPKEAAVEFLMEKLESEEQPLARVGAADLLKAFTGDAAVRRRIMPAFRREVDARVRVRLLSSLVWTNAEQPPPEVLAFLLARLREPREPEVTEFVVAILGTARVRSAIEPLNDVAGKAKDSALKARINEALRNISTGGGGAIE